MTGRDIFTKYNNVIRLIIACENRLPKWIRIKKFNKLCYKTGRLAMLRRYVLLSTLAKSVGKNVSVFSGVYFENIENLTIGNNVSIHQMCYIDAEGGIEIGNDVSIAHRTTILSSNHGYENLDEPIKYQKMILEKTTISDNVWIGCGCVVLAGCEIKEGCVVGANSTVTHSIDSCCVVVGSPAKIINKRN